MVTVDRCMHLQVASVDKRLWPNWEFLEERVGVSNAEASDGGCSLPTAASFQHL